MIDNEFEESESSYSFFTFLLGMLIMLLIYAFVLEPMAIKGNMDKKDKEIFEDHVKNYGCVVKVEDSKIVCVEESGRKFILPQ